MADLKTTIAQTENLKNKVKLAKQRINETVVRGGGITSKSLSEIPDNINKMLGQYKKVAIIDIGRTLTLGRDKAHLLDFSTNANFDVKEFIVFVSCVTNVASNQSPLGLYSRYLTNYKYIFLDYKAYFNIKLTIKNKNIVTLDIKSDSDDRKFRVDKIIAIG